MEVLFIGEHVEGLSGGGEGVDFVGHWADEFELDLVFELVEVVGLGDVFGEVVSGTEKVGRPAVGFGEEGGSEGISLAYKVGLIHI